MENFEDVQGYLVDEIPKLAPLFGGKQSMEVDSRVTQ